MTRKPALMEASMQGIRLSNIANVGKTTLYREERYEVKVSRTVLKTSQIGRPIWLSLTLSWFESSRLLQFYEKYTYNHLQNKKYKKL